MNTEYGDMFYRTGEVTWFSSRADAEERCTNPAHLLVAREVSDHWLVSRV